jgi:hypothetical protein
MGVRDGLGSGAMVEVDSGRAGAIRDADAKGYAADVQKAARCK